VCVSAREPETGRDSFRVADTMPGTLKSGFVRGVHVDICQQRKVVALTETGEMRFQKRRQRRRGPRGARERTGVLRVGEELDALTLEERRFGRQVPVFSYSLVNAFVAILLAST
jgi:hypothetical protein